MIQLGNAHFLAGAHRSIEHPRNRQSSEIIAIVKIRDEDLQRPGSVALGQRNLLHNGIEKRP